MVTKKELMSRIADKTIGDFDGILIPMKGVLTKDEAEKYIKHNPYIDGFFNNDKKVLFFTDNYDLLTDDMDTGFACTCYHLPIGITPRKGYESGMVRTLDIKKVNLKTCV